MIYRLKGNMYNKFHTVEIGNNRHFRQFIILVYIFGSGAGYQFVSLWQIKCYVSKYIVLCPKYVRLNQSRSRVNCWYLSFTFSAAHHWSFEKITSLSLLNMTLWISGWTCKPANAISIKHPVTHKVTHVYYMFSASWDRFFARNLVSGWCVLEVWSSRLERGVLGDW